jgi:hypothetical protein
VDEVLVRDIKGAEILASDGTLMTKVRVFITSHRMIVWRTDANKVPGIVLEVKLAEPNSVCAQQAKLGYNERIEVATLTKGYIINQGKCLCGSVLLALPTPAPWKRTVSA